MDLIVAVCRALANPARLELLHIVHIRPGITVQVLAAVSQRPVAAVSRELKLLRSFHLIQTVPRGRYVKCLPAPEDSTNQRFLRGLQVLLKPLLATKEPNRTLVQVCGSTRAVSWSEAWEAMEKIFTAYTHLRRLLILRRLAQNGFGTNADLVENVRISPDALLRHMAKLQRRHLVQKDASKQERWCLTSASGAAFRRRMLDLVLRELKLA